MTALKKRNSNRGGTLPLYFYGIAIGAADLIPGISGGTVAFILGIYDDLILSIKKCNFTAFLLPLLLGVVTALALLTNGISYLLAHESYSTFLYASFIGLVVASALFCAKRVSVWRLNHLLTAILGAVVAFVFTALSPEAFDAAATNTNLSFFHPTLYISGLFAICFTLLPGVSGSYLLTILGVYPAVIAALAAFVNGIAALQFDAHAFGILFSLGLGILSGALLFSCAISWLLRHHHDTAIALLTGFMVGSLPTVWPFDGGDAPAVGSPLFWQTMLCGAGGFAAIVAIETLANKTKTRSTGQK